MKSLAFLMAILSGCLYSTAYVHNGTITIDPVEYDNLNPYDPINTWHNNLDEGYGSKVIFTVNVTNTGTEQWGDFHFVITGDAASVLFTALDLGGEDPTSSQALEDRAIDNPVEGLSSMDLFFYGDPVDPGEAVWFTVYTDNTAEELSFFGICIYPTPVPEPAMMALLGLGGLALLRRKK